MPDVLKEKKEQETHHFETTFRKMCMYCKFAKRSLEERFFFSRKKMSNTNSFLFFVSWVSKKMVIMSLFRVWVDVLGLNVTFLW